MIRIEDLVEKVWSRSPGADLNLLRRAYLFAAREHRGQKLESGESYLVHCLEVANILADLNQDVIGVSAGLLCNVIQDKRVELDTIQTYFHSEVRDLIQASMRPAEVSE